MLIGAHVSAAGGIDQTIDRAKALGAATIQSFASSPRSIRFQPYADEVIDRYIAKHQESNGVVHVFHGVYLINLAHVNPDYVQASVDSLNYYQTLAGRIGAMGTVFHIGSHKGDGLASCLDRVAEAICRVLEVTPTDVMLLLENAAGHKGVIGATVEELALIIEAVAHKRKDIRNLGICVDTQHAFASGYDIVSLQGLEEFLRLIERLIGLDRIGLVHVNDSMTPFGGHRDRHANIGEGMIGANAIGQFVRHKKLTHLPMVLEVPGEHKSGPRKVDVDQLLELAS